MYQYLWPYWFYKYIIFRLIFYISYRNCITGFVFFVLIDKFYCIKSNCAFKYINNIHQLFTCVSLRRNRKSLREFICDKCQPIIQFRIIFDKDSIKIKKKIYICTLLKLFIYVFVYIVFSISWKPSVGWLVLRMN